MTRRPMAMDPRRIGVLIGVIGGVVFVTAYSWSIGSPANIVANVVAIALAALAVWRLYLAPRDLGSFGSLHKFAWLIYGASVVAMIVLINVGRRLLAAKDLENASPALIALVVGLHFLPFAYAFPDKRHFTILGLVVAGIGAIGLLLGVLIRPELGAMAAVVAGFAQLLLQLGYLFRRRTAAEPVMAAATP